MSKKEKISKYDFLSYLQLIQIFILRYKMPDGLSCTRLFETI